MKVHIRVTTKAEYSTVVEMTREEFERLDAKLKEGDGKVQQKIYEMVDPMDDWVDENLEEIDTFEEFKEEEESSSSNEE